MICRFLLVISWIFMIFGLLGLFRFHNFYKRALVCSKIDTVAFLTLMFALSICQGLSLFSLKVLMIMVFYMLTNPVSTHLIVRSAYRNKVSITDISLGSKQEADV